MNDNPTDKKYDPLRIPDPPESHESGISWTFSQKEASTPASQDDGLFYVIDYNSLDMKGVGKFVLKSQKIDTPPKDEIRELFHSMRDIARANHVQFYGDIRFYNPRVQQENAKVFYKQGLFMKDFTDNYSEVTPFSSYFPSYQLMSYEQLRTYFSWRTEVRKGIVTDTSLSYAFLYQYELLNQIGVEDPQDSLHRLMSFWQKFSNFNQSMDKYVLRWLKDYHIYYELPQSFQEFVQQNNLSVHYPKLANTENNFNLFCSISKYDIRSSTFCTKDNLELITDCFSFLTDRLRQVFTANQILLDDFLFQPAKKMTPWHPFKDALFYDQKKQVDRRMILSESEIYYCKENNWTTNTAITSAEGKEFIGFLLKQMEAALRIATKYKYKLTVNSNATTLAVVEKLKSTGLSLENIINDTVTEFYRDATKTVVTIDPSVLSRIRVEALVTQSKLIVPEGEEVPVPIPTPVQSPIAEVQYTLAEVQCTLSDMLLSHGQDRHQDLSPATPPPPYSPFPSLSEPVSTSISISGGWSGLKNALTPTELQALALLSMDARNIKQFADHHGIMLEVLMDGINEKAMDFVGDNLLDEEFMIYDDYNAQVKDMVR